MRQLHFSLACASVLILTACQGPASQAIRQPNKDGLSSSQQIAITVSGGSASGSASGSVNTGVS